MAKMLSQNDWNFNNIGTKFELDEVIPKFETKVRADANGEIIKNRDGSERRFNTDKIIGWKYNVTIKDGQFKKKSNPSVRDNPDALVLTTISKQWMKYQLHSPIYKHYD